MFASDMTLWNLKIRYNLSQCLSNAVSNFLSQAQEIGMQGQTSYGHALSLFPTFFPIGLYGAAISTIKATG